MAAAIKYQVVDPSVKPGHKVNGYYPRANGHQHKMRETNPKVDAAAAPRIAQAAAASPQPVALSALNLDIIGATRDAAARPQSTGVYSPYLPFSIFSYNLIRGMDATDPIPGETVTVTVRIVTDIRRKLDPHAKELAAVPLNLLTPMLAPSNEAVKALELYRAAAAAAAAAAAKNGK